jgi:hypothetical protein
MSSCAARGPGLTDCGEDKESCCTSLLVEGGTFFRTYQNSGTGPTHLADPATVSSFRLDKYVPPPDSGKHSHVNGGKGLANSGKSGGIRDGAGREMERSD